MEFGKYIAHRGLHDNIYPENSIGAFREAVNKRVPVEFDIRLTKDYKLIVFHDSNLNRMCGADADISDFTYEQLQAFTLGESDEKIPLFSDVLKLVKGRIPLLIEIKESHSRIEIVKRTLRLLKKYKGDYAIESFDPIVLLLLRIFSPDTERGQLISKYKGKSLLKYMLKMICSNKIVWKYISKPNFIACDLRTMSLETAFKAVDIGADLYTWTANSPELIETALTFSKTVIGENFPKDFNFQK